MPSLWLLNVIHILRRRHFQPTSGETSEKNLTQKKFYRTKRFAVKFKGESIELFLTYQVYFRRYRHFRPTWLKKAKIHATVNLWNLHSSLSSSFPRDVIESACKNSSNSILPSPLSSNTLNTNLKNISMDGKWVFYSLGKCGRITRWEKLIVDFWKFATSESSCRTIFHETLMPMLYFNRCNLMKFLCDRGRYMWQCENVTYSTSRVLTAKFNLQSHSP